MNNQWRDVLDALAELGRTVLAERVDEKTRPDADRLAASASSRVHSTSTVKPKRGRSINHVA